MAIVIQNEFKIFLDSFYAYKTYAGLLAGLPSDELNKSIINRIPEIVEKTMGSCKIHMLPPKIKLKYNAIPYLPPWIFAVRLHSRAVQPNADGAMLILVWFSSKIPISAEGELHQAVDQIDWKMEAEEFYF